MRLDFEDSVVVVYVDWKAPVAGLRQVADCFEKTPGMKIGSHWKEPKAATAANAMDSAESVLALLAQPMADACFQIDWLWNWSGVQTIDQNDSRCFYLAADFDC